MNSKKLEPSAKTRKPAAKTMSRGATAAQPKKKKGPAPMIIPGALE